MKSLKEIMNFFVGSEDVEKETLKRELDDERAKYDTQKQEVKKLEENTKVNVKKQVLFMDEEFERKVEKTPTNTNASNNNNSTGKYSTTNERQFSPSDYISPVHGLIKEAEPVEIKTPSKETYSESDYTIIREKAFGQNNNEETSDRPFKMFETGEIIDINKRANIDEEELHNMTIDEAYVASSNDRYVDTKLLNNSTNEITEDLFDLLNELSGEEDE